MTEMDFTGEQFVPGKTSKRMEEDFLARYQFAFGFVRDAKVLDIACGAGYGSYLLKTSGHAGSVDGVDVDVHAVEYARSHFQADGLAYFRGDLTDFGTSGAYDVVTCFESIEHVSDHQSALKNLFRVLKNDGTVILTTPNRSITSPHCSSLHDKPASPYHQKEFTVPELRDAMEDAGFRVDSDDIFGSRQQRYFKNRYLRRLYKSLWKPDIHAKARFERLHAMPRYILMIGHKNTL